MLAFTVSTKGTVLTCEIGSKSLTGSYGSLAKKDGLTVWPLAVSSTVYPSGACLATYSVAMLPPAPGRFSTMTGCPSARSEEHTSELQSLAYVVCRLLLAKNNPHMKLMRRRREFR